MVGDGAGDADLARALPGGHFVAGIAVHDNLASGKPSPDPVEPLAGAGED
jgi:hypothetical protein